MSIHCPLNEHTKHLINAEKLRLMKSTAYLINTARGAVVDEAALCAALEAGVIAGAGLDVPVKEPPPADSPLYTLDRVILTPHIGWKKVETRQRLMELVAGNIAAFLAGKPINVVGGTGRPQPPPSALALATARYKGAMAVAVLAAVAFVAARR